MQEAGSIYSGCPRHARNIRPNILYAKLFNYLRSSPFSPKVVVLYVVIIVLTVRSSVSETVKYMLRYITLDFGHF